MILLLFTFTISTYAKVPDSFPLSLEVASIKSISQIARWGDNPPMNSFYGKRIIPKLEGNKAQYSDAREIKHFLIILGESIGAKYLKDYGFAWDTMPQLSKWMTDDSTHTNIKLDNLNSNSTCTTMSMTSILTGVSPVSPLQKSLSSYTLFNVFKFNGYKTFLHSAQNLRWQNLKAFLVDSDVDSYYGAELVDEKASDMIGSSIADKEVFNKTLNFIKLMDREATSTFGVLHLNTTHIPYRVRDESSLEFNESNTHPSMHTDYYRYLSSLHYLDESLGDFFAELQKTNNYGKMTIIFLSDHGEAWGQHGKYLHCELNGHTEEMHIPGFIKTAKSISSEKVDSKIKLNILKL